MIYPGGKNGAGVFQAIINQIPPHQVYIEAFAGSAAVFRHKLPARTSYLIDIDPLVNLELAAAEIPIGPPDLQHRQVRRGGISRRVRRCGPDRRGRSADYRGTAAPPMAAALGMSADATGVICVHADAAEWLASYSWRGNEFVYLDPPYLAETRRGRQRRIYRCELRGRSEHKALLLVIKKIPAAVMISGYWSALYGKELLGWRTLTFRASTRGGPADEVLWMNYPEPVALHDYRYLGETFRQRQDFKRMRERWARKLAAMPILKRQALTAAVLQ